MTFFEWLKNKSKDETGAVFTAFIIAGAIWGGFIGVGAIVATTLGAVVIGALAGVVVGYALEAIVEFFVPDITFDSSTYKGRSPVYTVEEGKPIAKCYGRCRIAGNVVRSNDPGETTIKVIIGHGQGELDGLLSWKINNIEWDSLTSVAWWIDGVASQGLITVVGEAFVDETFVIDTQTFTFKDERSGTGEVTRSEWPLVIAANIVTAITADLTTVTAVADGITVVCTAATPGIAGNDIVFTEAALHMTMDGSGTLGGTTAGVDDYSGSVHFKNTLNGTDSQNPIEVNGASLFDLNPCAYRGIAHTGFDLKKNTQIGSFGSILVEGLFTKCSPIGISLVNSAYKWTESVAQAGEFHVELAAGGDPSITAPSIVEINEANVTEGTVGSLAVDEWDYGDNDAVGYSTIYVRITADADPDTKDDDYIGYEKAKAFSRNPSVVMWDFYRNVEDYSISELNINAFKSLESLCNAYPSSGEGGPIRPPGPNKTTVKATSYYANWRHAPFWAFGNNLAIDGTAEYTSWVSANGLTTDQRLNVDLGVAVKLTKIVLINSHHFGAGLTQGIQNFVIQGSNTAADLNHTAYADGASGWTDVQTGLTATQYDSTDPYKDYVVASLGIAYRYYSIKIADGHAGASSMGIRDICFWGHSPRYTFDYNFDSKININDAKKLIWSSFNGRVIRSQGKLKPVWDWSTMADGSGGLTAKTSRYSFTMDNIVEDSFTWNPTKRANKIKIEYLDSSEGYKKTPITEKDDSDIDARGEVLLDIKAYYITQQDVAARRCKRQLYRAMYADYRCKLSGWPSSQKLEVYDLVQVTHTLPGWTAKKFIVLSKSEDEYGRPTFWLEAYYSGVFDDFATPMTASSAAILINPKIPPISSTDITAILVSPGTGYDFDAVKVAFTPPNDPFYSYTEIYASKDNSTYYLAGESSGEDFVINGMGTIYQPGDTCYVKLVNINSAMVAQLMPTTYDAFVVIEGTIKLAGFYAGLNDFWGGNAAIGNVATTIVLGNLDGVFKIALGPTADLISVTGTAPGFIADGTGKVYFGDGANKYFKFDGTNITWKAANTELDASGNLIATSVTLTGSITATSGVIGGFTVNVTEGLYAGSGVTRVQMKAGTGFWAGATAFADAPFRVNQAGEAWLENAHIQAILTAGELHIPDQNTTANSFHTNTNGDSWWGCTETSFNADCNNANAYILKSGYAKFQDVELADLITLDHTNSDFFIINFDNTDIDTELRFGRTTGGTASFTWNGALVQCSKSFLPTELGINNISVTEPGSPFAKQVWLDVS